MSTVPFREYYQYSNHKIKGLCCCSVEPKLNSVVSYVKSSLTALGWVWCPARVSQSSLKTLGLENLAQSLLHHVFPTPNHELRKIRASLHISISPKRFFFLFPPRENSSYPKNKKIKVLYASLQLLRKLMKVKCIL